MSDKSFSVQVSYASVDRVDGGDVRPATNELLSKFRVVSAIRDASAPWSEGQDAVVLIAMTDDATVLTLSAQGTIETTLMVQELQDAFDTAGMTLWPNVGGDDIDDGFESEAEAEAIAELWDADDDSSADGLEDEALEIDGLDDADLEAMFDEQPVRVAAFSHRGPVIARYLAELTGSSVDYVEAGTWSLCRYATTEPTEALPPTKAEGPVIELNIVDGSNDWIEVRVPGLSGITVPFWPQGERDTQPVIDLESITVPETKEIYRRLIAEGDGARDELAELAAVVPVDVEAAHRALAPESLGGIAGADARTRAFLAAFQVPAALIELALAGDDPEGAAGLTGLAGRMRVEPQGWARGIGDAIVGGYGEALPLPHRDRWDGRLSRRLRANPLLATALSVGELALGVLSTKHLRGGWKSIGVLLIVDAVGDLVVAAVRRKRR